MNTATGGAASAGHFLLCACAAIAVLGTGPAIEPAHAQATPAQKPQPAAPVTDQDTATETARQARDTANSGLSLFDTQLPVFTGTTTPPPSWLSGIEMNCIGCPGAVTFSGPPSTNPNAPWLLHGKWRRDTPFGTASVGFAGMRNSALPLSTMMPLGAELASTTLGSSHTGFFMPSTQWSVTAGLEKTLKRFSNGATIGVAADFMVPVHTTAIGAGDPRLGAMKAAAFRFGIVIRW